MKLIKQLRFYIIGIIISALVCFLEVNSYLSVGSLINSIFPCKQGIAMSAPCYIGYDIAATIIFPAILAVLVLLLIIKIIKCFDKSSFRLRR